MPDEEYDRFILGRSFFRKPWVEAPASTGARDGLGPLFSANSCVACHRNNGGGNAVASSGDVDRSLVIHLAQNLAAETADPGWGKLPDPVYGTQISVAAIPGVPFEARIAAAVEFVDFAYPDGDRRRLALPRFRLEERNYGELAAATSLSPRRAPALVGLGLIERIPQAQIEARADPADRDGDGISGRINRVWSQQHAAWRPGRFGWKASAASVIEQSARALAGDMGLTSRYFPRENCSESQRRCREAHTSRDLDVPDDRLAAIAHYLKNLKTPRSPARSAGSALFDAAGCRACHRTGYTSAEGIAIDPYSDFLLHDMGDALADGAGVYDAGPREWRTPPLWGIGLARTLNPAAGFLHDGRARTVEEAILWHAGEAAAARIKFVSMNAADRGKLLSFIESL